jgi:hypothetical protein
MLVAVRSASGPEAVLVGQTGRRAENPAHHALPVARDLGDAGAITFSDKSAIQLSRTDRLHPTTAQ